MQRRSKSRITKRLTMRYSSSKSNIQLSGITRNISEKGLFLQANVLLPVGEIICMRLTLEDGKSLELWGIIRWRNQVPPNMVNIMAGGMGIELINPPESYVNYVYKLKSKTVSQSNEDREFIPTYQVVFSNVEQFIHEYNHNIRNGGIFIRTEQVKKPGETIILSIKLPETSEVLKVEGSVVYSIDPVLAVERGQMPGMGISFTRFKKNDQQKLLTYISRVIPQIKNIKNNEANNRNNKGNIKLEWEGYRLWTVENVDRYVEERGGVYKLAMMLDNKGYEVFFIGRSSNLNSSLKEHFDKEDDENFHFLKRLKEGKCYFNVAYLFDEEEREEIEKALFSYYKIERDNSEKFRMARLIM